MPWHGWGGGAANAVFWCPEIGELRPTGLLAESPTLVWLDEATGYVVRISAFLENRKALVLSPLWLKTRQSCGSDARHSASPLC